MAKSKMYILVKDSLTPGHVALACAHASLSGYLTFVKAERAEWENLFPALASIDCGYETNTEIWAQDSFRKVICSVSAEQFEQAKTFGVPDKNYRVMTESSLDNAEVAIVFRPRENWEPFFKDLPLYGQAKTVEINGLTIKSCLTCGSLNLSIEKDVLLGKMVKCPVCGSKLPVGMWNQRPPI